MTIELHCPYCKDFRLDFSDSSESVVVDNFETGTIVYNGVRCRHNYCKGSREPFSIRIGYVSDEDDIQYRDKNDYDLTNEPNIRIKHELGHGMEGNDENRLTDGGSIDG